MWNCGIDVALKSSSVCVLDGRGRIVLEKVVSTDEVGFGSVLGARRRMRCVLEAGPLAEWISQLIEQMGHEAVVIDPRKATGVIRTKKKTDRLDARNLARMGRTGWYTKVHRKSAEARATRTFLQARQGLVETALAQGSRIRGLLRAHGVKLGEVKESEFASRVKQLACEKGEWLWDMLEPLVEVRRLALGASEQMRRQLVRQSSADGVLRRLMSVPGVGALTAAAFRSTIDDPYRFRSSKQVSAYVGLVPSVAQSGQMEVHGHITREGDGLLRSYLVEAAHILLTRTRRSYRLKLWGLKLAKKKGHGKARVAVARKLAALLHRLWITEESYQAA
ncbi:MAG TPA: IS110 family transposase [Thermoanaerobaculia bacterium]|nr:IS110 family transposase [Thermoanaerobaculia bacterium]